MIRIKRLVKSFVYAFRGLSKAVKEEQNIKIQIFVGTVVLILGVVLKIKIYEFLFLLILIFLVILTEMINSSVERIADALKPRLDVYVKEIKDMMAGAVMLSSLLSVIVGLIIFVPYFLKLWN